MANNNKTNTNIFKKGCVLRFHQINPLRNELLTYCAAPQRMLIDQFNVLISNNDL